MRTEYMVAEWAGEMDWPFYLRWSRCFNAGIGRGLHTVVSTTAQLDFNGCNLGQSRKPLAASCFDLGKWLQLMWDLSTGHWLSRERQGWLLRVNKAEKSYRPQTKSKTMQGTYSRAEGTELPCRGKAPKPEFTLVCSMERTSWTLVSQYWPSRPQKVCRLLSDTLDLATVYPWPKKVPVQFRHWFNHREWS